MAFLENLKFNKKKVIFFLEHAVKYLSEKKEKRYDPMVENWESIECSFRSQASAPTATAAAPSLPSSTLQVRSI